MASLRQSLLPSALSREFPFFFPLFLLKPSYNLSRIRPDHPVDGPAMILPSPLPEPSKRAKPVVPQASSPPSTPLRVQKRPAPDGVDEAQPAKRARTVTSLPNHSPSASRRLEEDGLVLLDRNGPVDQDVDIVVID